jgi:hypothetical protein
MKTHLIIPAILVSALGLADAQSRRAPKAPPGGAVYFEPPAPERNPWADQGIASNHGFGAYYTRKHSDEPWQLQSRTDEFADVMVRFPGSSNELVFWRGTSYLPYWKTGDKQVAMEEIIPRTGDGPPGRPDKVNRYSHVRVIESTPERAVVQWRYMPRMLENVGPDNLPDQTQMVDEYYVVFPDRTVLRAVLAGQPRYEDWRASVPGQLFRYKLTDTGLEKLPGQPADKELMTRVMGFADQKVRVIKPAPIRPLPDGLPVPLARFSLDEGEGLSTVESTSRTKLPIDGHAAHWRAGVSGTALMMDGYTSRVGLDIDLSGKVDRNLTIDTWIAIAAYPWNTCPVVQQVKVGPDGLTEENGFMLAVGADGKASMWVTIGDQRAEVKAGAVLPRFRWIRLTGVVETADDKSSLRLYLDGKLAGETKAPGGRISLPGKQALQLARGVKRMPARPVGKGQYPSEYTFEGLIDEVAVYPAALTNEQIDSISAAFAMSEESRDNPDMIRRVLPIGEKDWNNFAARYTHLPFHDAWYKMFRFSGHPDIVVSFDKMPVRFVLWRGANYIPMLVTENGRWYTNAFLENWWKGCCEPMSDKKMVFGRVDIIEQSPARVVLRWRYPLSEVGYQISYEDPETGWGNWTDWYLVIYPDGTMVKRKRLYTDAERRHEWQESIAIMGPEQRPEDVIETTPALTLATPSGEIREYSWIGKPPTDVSYKDTVLHIANMKAEYDPYSIQNITGGDVYKAGGGSRYSAFPAWNHWPVGQFLSDGRHAVFPDRTAHSSLTHIKWKDSTTYNSLGRFHEKLLLEGLSNKPAKELLPLALSWLQPAPATTPTEGLAVNWQAADRAYVLTRANSNVKNLQLKLAGTAETPLVNPVVIVENWGQEKTATITLNGGKPAPSMDIRQGVVTRANGVKALVVWIEHTGTANLDIGIESNS